MLSIIRLKGRKLLIGSTTLFVLTLAVGMMLIFSLSFMPLAYRSAIGLFSSYTRSFTPYISLAVSVAMLALTLLSYRALRLGSDRYMLKRAQGVHADTRDIFFYFRPAQATSLIGHSTALLIIRLLLFLLVNIPAVLSSLLVYFLARSSASALVLTIIALSSIAFFISALYFYSLLSASLFLVKYYYIKGEYLCLRHLVSSSADAMKGRSRELFLLRLSFTGWFFSCLFIFPIGYVWSYYNQTLAAYGDEIMKLQ